MCWFLSFYLLVWYLRYYSFSSYYWHKILFYLLNPIDCDGRKLNRPGICPLKPSFKWDAVFVPWWKWSLILLGLQWFDLTHCNGLFMLTVAFSMQETQNGLPPILPTGLKFSTFFLYVTSDSYNFKANLNFHTLRVNKQFNCCSKKLFYLLLKSQKNSSSWAMKLQRNGLNFMA